MPDLGDPASFGLTPAMTFAADLAVTKAVPAGQGVSYGHQYVTDRDTTLALVPVGYADGIPRNATNVGPVGIGGVRHTVAGRVCMDQFVVDVGPEQQVRPGQEVVIFGRAGPASRRPRTGPGRPGPSPMRSSPASVPACPAST